MFSLTHFEGRIAAGLSSRATLSIGTLAALVLLVISTVVSRETEYLLCWLGGIGGVSYQPDEDAVWAERWAAARHSPWILLRRNFHFIPRAMPNVIPRDYNRESSGTIFILPDRQPTTEAGIRPALPPSPKDC